MQEGDLVKTCDAMPGEKSWWWNDRIGVIINEAIFQAHSDNGKCWHVMIEDRTANLSEQSMNLIAEAKFCDIYELAMDHSRSLDRDIVTRKNMHA